MKKPKFKQDQKVIISKGFYKGIEGTINTYYKGFLFMQGSYSVFWTKKDGMPDFSIFKENELVEKLS